MSLLLVPSDTGGSNPVRPVRAVHPPYQGPSSEPLPRRLEVFALVA